MILSSRSTTNGRFTRLHAKIFQEDGVITVSVRLQNHLKLDESAWGEEVAGSIEIASSMIRFLADEFSIAQEFISIDIRMDDARGATLH